MHWNELKKLIYFEDGSLRDIYVLDTSIAHWEKWVDMVNSKYKVKFWDAKTDLRTDKIDFETVKEYWDSNGQREVVTATISLETITIKCYFFDDSEIENDVDPREFKSEEDHIKLVHYLNDISVTLNKEVIVTDENITDSVLIRGNRGECILNGNLTMSLCNLNFINYFKGKF
jgi:hypothetical protein